MSELVRVIFVAFVSSGAMWSIALFYLNNREKKREAAEERKEKEREEKERREEAQRVHDRERDETWFEEAGNAYKRIEEECNKCNNSLGALRRRFHRLLWALDDICDHAGNGDVKVVDLRAAVRLARQEPEGD